MDPIAYVARLNEFYRSQRFPAYQWTVNESAPLTPLAKPQPFDKVRERTILFDALRALESIKRGGDMIDLPYKWEVEFGMNLGSGYRAKTA